VRRLPAALAVPVLIAVAGMIVAAAAIGLANDGARQALGWPLLLLVALCALLEPRRRAGLYAALLAFAVFVGVDAARLAASGHGPRAIDVTGLIVTPLALLATPLLLGSLVRRLELLVQEVEQQQSAIDTLTVRDEDTGAFRPRYIDTLLPEEINRARRYHRALTLAIVAVDGWPELICERGEPAAHALARQIVEQLAQGTRVVDRIVQLGEGEFALVLPETPLEEAEVLAVRVQEAASTATGLMLRVGLASFPRDAVSGAALLQEAREALSYARAAGLFVVDRLFLHHGR